jgi:hypothetical protein
LNTSYGGTGKVILSINLTKVTYNGEIGYCSSNLVLGSSSTVHQPLPHMLLLFSSHKMVAKDWGKGNTKKGRVSLLLFFSLFKWDPYPFFYRLKRARYLVE